MRKGALLSLLFLVVAFALATSASQNAIILGTTNRITELSFANSRDPFTWHILRHTTQALVGLAPGTNELIPAIAEAWDISDDGLTYSFHIRPGITFWDGVVCDANAVKWSLERTIRLNGPNGMVRLIKDLIDNIEVIDDLTLQIMLKKPDATFLVRMTDYTASALIYSPESTPMDNFANGQYAGTGPYKLVEHVPDQYVTLEAYDEYFGSLPATRKIVWKLYSESATVSAALQAGDIDVAFRGLTQNDIGALRENPNLQVVVGPSTHIRYLLFNVSRPPVDKRLVRQAISYAVDRDAIIALSNDLNQPIYSMVPEGCPPIGASINVFPEYDLEQARALLRQAGYSEDNPLEINLWYPSCSYYVTSEGDVATVLEHSIEETGMVRITLQALTWEVYQERRAQGALDMFLHGWYPEYLDASEFLAPFTTKWPEPFGTFFNHHPNYERYEKMMQEALSTVDEQKRAGLYQEIQRLSAEDVPWIPLWADLQEAWAAASKYIEGLVFDLSMEPYLGAIEKQERYYHIAEWAGFPDESFVRFIREVGTDGYLDIEALHDMFDKVTDLDHLLGTDEFIVRDFENAFGLEPDGFLSIQDLEMAISRTDCTLGMPPTRMADCLGIPLDVLQAYDFSRTNSLQFDNVLTVELDTSLETILYDDAYTLLSDRSNLERQALEKLWDSLDFNGDGILDVNVPLFVDVRLTPDESSLPEDESLYVDLSGDGSSDTFILSFLDSRSDPYDSLLALYKSDCHPVLVFEGVLDKQEEELAQYRQLIQPPMGFGLGVGLLNTQLALLDSTKSTDERDKKIDIALRAYHDRLREIEQQRAQWDVLRRDILLKDIQRWSGLLKSRQDVLRLAKGLYDFGNLTLTVVTVASGLQAVNAAAKALFKDMTIKLVVKEGSKYAFGYTIKVATKVGAKSAFVKYSVPMFGRYLMGILKDTARKEAAKLAFKAQLTKRVMGLVLGGIAKAVVGVTNAADKLAVENNLDKDTAWSMKQLAISKVQWRAYGKLIDLAHQAQKQQVELASMCRKLRSTPTCTGTWYTFAWTRDAWGSVSLEQTGSKVTGLFGWIPSDRGFQIDSWFTGHGPARDLKVGQVEGTIDAKGNVSLRWWKGVTRDKKYTDAAITERGILKLILQENGTLKGYWLLDGQQDSAANRKNNTLLFRPRFN